MMHVVAGILQIFILSFVIFALNSTISVDATNSSDSIFSISSVENLSNDKGHSRNPQLVVLDTNVCVAWHNEFYDETADGQSYTQQNILFRKGSDYGKTFSNVTSLADNAAAGGIHPVRLATSGTSVYVAWNNGSGISDHGTISNNELFLRTGVACGEEPFSSPIVLSSSNGSQSTVAEPPELAASGGFVYAVWSTSNWEAGNTELSFKRSTDYGATFEKTVNLTDEDGLSSASVFMRTTNADANLLDVIWTGYNGTGDKGVFLKRSLDYGETFEKTVPIHVHGSDGNVGIAGDPNVASSDENLFVVWRDNYYGPSGNFIIYLKAIPAGDGEHFGDTIAISDKTREASFPQIAVFENNVYVVWEDNTDPENRETFFRASTDGGRTFGKIINLSNNPGDSYHARLATSDSAIFVVWSDESVGNGDIILRTSTDNGANFGEAINLSNNSGWSASSQIVASKFTDLAYVVWQDGSPGNLDIFFRAISNNSTNNTENSVLSSLQVQEISIYAYQENSIADYHFDKPPLTSIYSGMPIVINGLVKNQNHTGEHFDYITQVIDENGITVYLGIRHQVAVPLGRQIGIDSQVSSPIVLNETGKYTIKVYTWLGSDKVPLPLSSGGIASIDVQQRITQEQAIEIADTDLSMQLKDYQGIDHIIVNTTSGYIPFNEFKSKNMTLPIVYVSPSGKLVLLNHDIHHSALDQENLGYCDSALHAYCGYLPHFNFDYKGRVVYGVEVAASYSQVNSVPFMYIVDAVSGKIVDSTFLRSEKIRSNEQ